MNLSDKFKKTSVEELPLRRADEEIKAPEVPNGLMKQCNHCGKAIYTDEVREKDYTCPKCGGYFRMPAQRRLKLICDQGSFREWDAGLETTNPLEIEGYRSKIRHLREKTGLDEAITTGEARINGLKTAIAVMDGRFLMASMGYVVGEKLVRMLERATQEKLHAIIFTCSGGARMQEGLKSLMQMTKTSAAMKKHSEAGLLSVCVLTDPTTGGVTASFAMLGDIILAEPGALIGFAGPRVIKQTIGGRLPDGFQRSEFILEHGFCDRVVERQELKEELYRLIKMHDRCSQSSERQPAPELCEKSEYCGKVSAAGSKERKRTLSNPLINWIENKLSPWGRVMKARDSERPVAEDYIERIFDDFTELHGDRLFGDDPAIIGGLGNIGGRTVTVLAQTKGHNTRERVRKNFGMPQPEGYRKAMRLMRQAEKFGRPVICFVDTPGAFCGMEAEMRGQGEAIASCIQLMSSLKVPALSIFIGEGGSGGALALASGNEVWMLENSVYSILSPEGYASILWKDAGRAKEAAGLMKLTALDIEQAGFVEKVYCEPEEFCPDNMDEFTAGLKNDIILFMDRYLQMSPEELREHKYQRFRAY